RWAWWRTPPSGSGTAPISSPSGGSRSDMPELPEVETVRQGLAKWVAGRRIASVEVHHPRAIRRHLPGSEHFAAVLLDRTIVDVRRRGKYLWLPLDSGDALIGHLGMSGQLLCQPSTAPD